MNLSSLAGATFLAACGHQLAADPMAPVRAWIGGPAATVSVSKGTVTMIVRPEVANQGFKTQALLPPYVATDITRLHIELWRVPNPDGNPPDTEPESEEAEVDLTQSQLNYPTTFSNLAANKRYEVRCQAFGVNDLGQEVQISDDLASYTTVDVGTDTVVDVTIRVKLGDSDFVGSGTSTVSIIPGSYTYSGSPSITVATPAPTPTPPPVLQASFTGGDFGTIAAITSIAGAEVGSNYLLSLDRIWSPLASNWDYTLHWGVDGNVSSDYLGNAWPPSQTTFNAPAGSGGGSLTLLWQAMAPTMDTTTGTVSVTVMP